MYRSLLPVASLPAVSYLLQVVSAKLSSGEPLFPQGLAILGPGPGSGSATGLLALESVLLWLFFFFLPLFEKWFL